ncbi:MAG: pirin family protein [Anaerolineales bacterium]
MNTVRPVERIIEPQYVMEGAGVLLRRSISPHVSNQFDPFLLFDHFAFNDPVEGPIRGFPMHPHRGIETVTYILNGSVNHRDSLGNSGLIGPGDIQWMTAGGGILHEEMPRRGPDGIINGFQLWVNLPATLKMTRPRYQGVVAADIPAAQGTGWQARVVAGEAAGVRGPVTEIAANPIYMEVALEAGAEFSQPLPEGHTALAYVFDGLADFAGQAISAVKLVVFGRGDRVEVRSGAAPVRFMLMAGAPFGEPIVPYGPFVMNTREEIQQALTDLRNGTFVRN